jgi:hypothetical protein
MGCHGVVGDAWLDIAFKGSFPNEVSRNPAKEFAESGSPRLSRASPLGGVWGLCLVST